MRYGINVLLWTDTISEETLPLLDRIKEIGYDAVEMPCFTPDVEIFAKWGARLSDLRLDRTACTVVGADANPISADPACRAKAVETLRAVLDCCQAAGVETLIGPYHSGLGVFSGVPATDDEWKWGVETMRTIAEYAETCGVRLAMECVNRFECYLLTTMEEGARFCDDVGHPACKLMYDTFHANIEEKNITQALQTASRHLIHVHISENDRSTPGAGGVNWTETFDALKEIGYEGLMTVEAFGLSLPKLAEATKIWRKMYESEWQLATDACAFMKENVAKRWG